MAKTKKKTGEISMVVFITKDFNLKLKKHLLDLEETGTHKTKSERIIELAQIGLQHETKLNHE
jgi:hypothetical protein